MSGALCPDCQGARYAPLGPRLWRCEACFWEGDILSLGRGMLSGPAAAGLVERERERAAGRLVAVRVVFAPGADPGPLVDAAMDLLDLRGCSSSASGCWTFVKARPPEEALAKLRALPGVSRVVVG